MFIVAFSCSLLPVKYFVINNFVGIYKFVNYSDLNEPAFRIDEQVLVEYKDNVTYNATVISLPKNGKVKVQWDSRGTDEVFCSQCISIDQSSSIQGKRPSRSCVQKKRKNYNEHNDEFDPITYDEQNDEFGQTDETIVPGKLPQCGDC